MPFTQDDLAQLATFVRTEVQTAVSAFQDAKPAATAADRASVVGVPDVAPDAGPMYWVHLADGSVIESYDSGSTHVDVGGVGVQVIGRYQIPEGGATLPAAAQVAQNPEGSETA